MVSQLPNFKAESWKSSEKSYTQDSTNQARWTVLPLTYDREVKDLVFLYKAFHGYIDIDISFIKSVSHGHTISIKWYKVFGNALL